DALLPQSLPRLRIRPAQGIRHARSSRRAGPLRTDSAAPHHIPRRATRGHRRAAAVLRARAGSLMALDRAKTLANAERFVKIGKVPEAIVEYKKLFEDNSRDMGVLNKLGDLCVRIGKNQDAIRYF